MVEIFSNKSMTVEIPCARPVRGYPPLFDENEPIPDQRRSPGLERVGENPENGVGSRPSVDR